MIDRKLLHLGRSGSRTDFGGRFSWVYPVTVCERQHRYPHLTLESLEAAIAAELEGFYLRQHGEEKGRQIACALLEDLMESGPLKAAPSLSFLGLVVMDELCARHIKAPVLH